VDEALERSRREGRAPFDGLTVQSPPLRAEQLRRLLLDVVPILLPTSAIEVVTFFDWHEHDGYIVRSENVSRQALLDALSTPDKFVAASSDDTFVRRAWYPTEAEFLLRWCLSSDPDDFGPPGGEPAGDLDVTGPADMAQTIAVLVEGSTVTAAKDFFDRR
jgi:hypothetical protein